MIDPFVDDELDLRTSFAVEEHVRACAACAKVRDARLALREAVARLPRPELPARFRRRRRMPMAVAIGGALAAAAAIALAVRAADGDELFEAHARSLMTGRPVDVASSDRHTVKPWFQGKVPVQDFAADGFALAGGRLEVLGGQPAAALVYRHGGHLLNLFAWPADRGPRAPASASRQGYSGIGWTADGLRHWLVGDIAEPELRAFADRLRATR